MHVKILKSKSLAASRVLPMQGFYHLFYKSLHPVLVTGSFSMNNR